MSSRVMLPRVGGIALALALVGVGSFFVVRRLAPREAATGLAAGSTASTSEVASSSSASSASRASSDTTSATEVPGPPIEARRSRVKRIDDEPALGAARDVVAKHFGDRAPADLSLQIVDRPGHGGHVVLALGAAAKAHATPTALAVATDAANQLAWIKERPAAGMTPPVSAMAIAPGERGQIALAACVPGAKRVALRLWDHDGSPFADFDAMDLDDCAAVSLLYWPRHGFVIVASRAGTTRAQLVTRNGGLAWRRGVDIGARTKEGAPASLAADSDDTFMLVQRGAGPAADSNARDRVLAFRYDVAGVALWSSPVDLGEATREPASDRVVLARPRAGLVRATLGAKDVDVTSAGAVSPR